MSHIISHVTISSSQGPHYEILLFIQPLLIPQISFSLLSSFVRANMHLGFTTQKNIHGYLLRIILVSIFFYIAYSVRMFSTCITLAIDHYSGPCQSQAMAVSMDRAEYSHVLSRYSSSQGSLAGGWATGWGSSTS